MGAPHPSHARRSMPQFYHLQHFLRMITRKLDAREAALTYAVRTLVDSTQEERKKYALGC